MRLSTPRTARAAAHNHMLRPRIAESSIALAAVEAATPLGKFALTRSLWRRGCAAACRRRRRRLAAAAITASPPRDSAVRARMRPPTPQAERGGRQPRRVDADSVGEVAARAYAGETTVDESAWWDDDGEYLGEMPDWREVRRQKAAAEEAKQEATAEAGDVLSGTASVDDYFAKGRELGKALAEQARQETSVANPGEISPDDYFNTDNGDMA